MYQCVWYYVVCCVCVEYHAGILARFWRARSSGRYIYTTTRHRKVYVFDGVCRCCDARHQRIGVLCVCGADARRHHLLSVYGRDCCVLVPSARYTDRRRDDVRRALARSSCLRTFTRNHMFCGGGGGGGMTTMDLLLLLLLRARLWRGLTLREGSGSSLESVFDFVSLDTSFFR